MKLSLPHLDFEKELWKQNNLVIGIDEVGRGALAGPVGVGAVCFDPKFFTTLTQLGINDSKKLTPSTREKLSSQIKDFVLTSSVSFSSVEVINTKGIVYAVNQAIRKSVSDIQSILQTSIPFYLLLDAFYVKHIKGIGLRNQTALIKGDEKCISIAAASIIAKVKRDQLMMNLSDKYPNYRWNENKGYGTKTHLQAIREFGPTNLHRTLYIRNVLQ